VSRGIGGAVGGFFDGGSFEVTGEGGVMGGWGVRWIYEDWIVGGRFG